MQVSSPLLSAVPMRRIKLAGRHVLITGGSAGIGLAVAKACMLQLATVTLVARTQSKLEAAQKELQELAVSKQLAVKVYIQAADVTCEEQVWWSFTIYSPSYTQTTRS